MTLNSSLVLQKILSSYLFRRMLLVVPTLVGILLVNFVIIQAAPGGPVDQAVARLAGDMTSVTATIAGGSSGSSRALVSFNRNSGIDPELIAELERQFGFDKPAHERFLKMLRDYFRFDFGKSFYQDVRVIDLILDRLPVTLSLGLATLLIVYTISLPLGIRKAVLDGSQFDVWTSIVIMIGYAIPAFVMAMLLVILFCGGEIFSWFPLRGLISDNYEQLSVAEQIIDRVWHMAMPVMAMALGSFATLTMLTKNSFLDEIHKQYVTTARAKGQSEARVLYGHVFRNAILIVIAGFPAALVGLLFTGSILIEVIFSLQGLGLLGFDAIMNRDYPIVFGALFIFSLVGLTIQLVTDVIYTLVDPRIDFDVRDF